MKDKIVRQWAQNIIFQDIALYLTSYIHQLELLLLGNPLLASFKSIVKNKPEIDNRGVKKDKDHLVCKAGL